MTQVSDRLQNLSESQTIAMAKRSREMQSQGIDVISLSLGEPDFNTPDFIKDSAKKAIDENFSKYTPVPGYLELREAICTKLERDNALEYNPNQIVVSTGAKQSIANVVLSLVNPGDVITSDKDRWVDVMMKEELNLIKEEKSPLAMGAMTFISFLIVGLVPLLAYLFDYNSEDSSRNLFGISIMLTSLAFIGIGWLKSYVTQTSRLRSITETLILGAAAATLSYFVGSFLESLIN